MREQLTYMPVFRGLQEELKVLKSFDFGDRIYPCLEIVKELDRLPVTPRKNTKNESSQKKVKRFEDVYLPIINSIKAKYVFVDLPVQLKDTRNMKSEALLFLRSVIANREKRTEYLNKLSPLSSKLIPVISTYFNRTGEPNSIAIQEKDLRPHFSKVAFRTFHNSFSNDILQIEKKAKKGDYIIVDWDDNMLDFEDDDQMDIVDRLKTIDCTIIIHRNSIPNKITNVGLEHGKLIKTIDNSLLDKYHTFSGNTFSDYAGIKRNELNEGGTISPGFIYYDAVENSFYGFKGKVKDLEEFKKTIVPSVISSDASSRMHRGSLDYLGNENIGWKIINRINQGIEPGGSPAKFKRIGIEHYLHCIKTRISNGDFD